MANCSTNWSLFFQAPSSCRTCRGRAWRSVSWAMPSTVNKPRESGGWENGWNETIEHEEQNCQQGNAMNFDWCFFWRTFQTFLSTSFFELAGEKKQHKPNDVSKEPLLWKANVPFKSVEETCWYKNRVTCGGCEICRTWKNSIRTRRWWRSGSAVTTRSTGNSLGWICSKKQLPPSTTHFDKFSTDHSKYFNKHVTYQTNLIRQRFLFSYSLVSHVLVAQSFSLVDPRTVCQGWLIALMPSWHLRYLFHRFPVCWDLAWTRQAFTDLVQFVAGKLIVEVCTEPGLPGYPCLVSGFPTSSSPPSSSPSPSSLYEKCNKLMTCDVLCSIMCWLQFLPSIHSRTWKKGRKVPHLGAALGQLGDQGDGSSKSGGRLF